jgi:hypothetical protein
VKDQVPLVRLRNLGAVELVVDPLPDSKLKDLSGQEWIPDHRETALMGRSAVRLSVF